jgi:hypothetical protein
VPERLRMMHGLLPSELVTARVLGRVHVADCEDADPVPPKGSTGAGRYRGPAREALIRRTLRRP